MTACAIPVSLGELLARHKRRTRVTSAALAQQLGVSKGTADRLLQNRMADPGITLVEAIATLLGTDLATIVSAVHASRQLQQEEENHSSRRDDKEKAPHVPHRLAAKGTWEPSHFNRSVPD